MPRTRGTKRTAPSLLTSGVKSSKSSSVSSPSASASTSAGYIVTDRKLCSVLAHPIGLPLAASLNGKTESGQPDFASQLYPNVDYDPHALDGIFSSAAKKWNGQREVDLTAKLLTELNKAEVVACTEKEIRGVDANGDDRRGKIDLLLGGDTSREEPQSVVTVIQVGLGNIEWWKKVDQGVTYVELLGDAQNKEFCFKKAMLLAVITVEKVGRGEESEALKARFGVFLCTPIGGKDSSDFRMSLLWREETQTLQDASRAFGKLILATYQCEKWRDMKPKLKYSYLGPNCCRFGEMVLRSYDTRLRATQRRPLLYLAQDEAQKSVIFPHENVAQTLLTFPKDVSNALEFGDPLPEDFELHRRDWLWTSRGKLLVIEMRYRHGRQHAEKPTDFLPIIEHLEYLHGREYVHGDIRAFNMVLGGSTEARADSVNAAVGSAEDTGSGGFVAMRKFLKGTFNRVFRAESAFWNDGSVGFIADKGCLIDFDFGGKQGEMTKYPHGYKQCLLDGFRIGQEGKVIQYKDDWHALGQVIFWCHDFCPPARLRQGKQQELDSQKVDVWRGLLNFPSGDSTGKQVIMKLKNFLRDAETAGYTVQRSRGFSQSFSGVENPSLTDTVRATGSPSNAK